MSNAHCSNEKDTHTECDGDDPLPGSRFVTTATDQAISNPSANRFGNSEREERE
jgi:hypothetical protein